MLEERIYVLRAELRWRSHLVGACVGPNPPKSCDSQCYLEVEALSVLLLALSQNSATLHILPCTSPVHACLLSCGDRNSHQHDIECDLPYYLHSCPCFHGYLPHDYQDCFIKDMCDVTMGDLTIRSIFHPESQFVKVTQDVKI